MSVSQYQAVLVTVTLQYSLKSSNVIPLVLFFLLRIAMASWLFLVPYEVHGGFFQFCEESQW